jgi:Do/DeqQ family serine protease
MPNAAGAGGRLLKARVLAYMLRHSFRGLSMPLARLLIAVPAAVVVAAVSFAAAEEQRQDARQVPASPAQVQLSYAPVVKRAAPAVVNVYAARVVENRNPFMNDPLFRQFFGAVPREQVLRSLGSGVIVDPSGLVVTNHHVIDGASEVKVALSDKREFDAEIVLKDEHSDLSVLRLKGANEKFPVLDFANSDDVQVGDLVLAIGDPFGVGQTVTHGIVSALARTQVGISDYQFFIQTDAAINPGNSGGALVDLNGRLVGINTAIYSRSGGSQGIGFAIPANMVRVVVTSARGGSAAVKRPWLGAKLQEVTPEIADSIGLKRPAGAVVANVAPAGPAERAGIKTGDVIVSIDGTLVDDPNSFDYRFATKALGGSAQVTLLRQGREAAVSIALQTAPELPREEVEIHARSPFLGAKVANLSPALADELRLDTAAQGVVIVSIADGSTAQTIGFQKGDIVVSVNNQKIERSADLDRITRAGGRQWRVTINRGGQQISVVFSG